METGMIQAELKCLKFSISIDSSIPKYVHSDPQKLQNILFNIISNSIKYTMQGEVKVNINVKEIEEDSHDQQLINGEILKSKIIEFTVEDSGLGIS
jgi:signal transduction histidine kinase